MGSLDVNAARGARAVPYLANVAANERKHTVAAFPAGAWRRPARLNGRHGDGLTRAGLDWTLGAGRPLRRPDKDTKPWAGWPPIVCEMYV